MSCPKQLFLHYIDRFGPRYRLQNDISEFVAWLNDDKMIILHRRQKLFREFLEELRDQMHTGDSIDIISQNMALRGMFWLRASEFIHARETRLSLRTLEKRLDKLKAHRKPRKSGRKKITDADKI